MNNGKKRLQLQAEAKMKKIMVVISAVCMLALAACASTGQGTKNKGEENTVIHPLGVKDSDYQQIMKSSVVSEGNFFRLKNVLERLKKGEKIYVAALGGSVTEGAGPADYRDGYAYQFAKKLAGFTPDNGAGILFNGAGLSGTPSPLGLVRYQSDVVDVLGHTPDLLVIEFAVNDGGEPTGTRAFEALIRGALEQNPDTAVIALYSAALYQNTQRQMKPVADYYGIPQVSISDAISRPVADGIFSDKDFFTDNVHPTKGGHELMADCLVNMLRLADGAPMPEEFSVPAETLKSPSFVGLKRISGDDGNVRITAGGFSSTDPNCQTIKKTNRSDFPQNWYHSPAGGADSFVMEIDCRNLLFVYKENGSWTNIPFGRAEVYVDGKLAGTYDGGKSGGWNNAVTVKLIDEAESSVHKVEVKMAEGSEKKGFTIVAMGYTK